MHIFNIFVTYLQSVEKIQWKLYEELISQSIHKVCTINHYLLGAVILK